MTRSAPARRTGSSFQSAPTQAITSAPRCRAARAFCLDQRLSGSFPVNVMLTGQGEDYFQNVDAIAALQRFQEFAETLPGVDKAVSFAEYLKLVNYASNRYEPEQYRLPEESFEVRMLINSYRMMLGQDMLDAFTALYAGVVIAVSFPILVFIIVQRYYQANVASSGLLVQTASLRRPLPTR